MTLIYCTSFCNFGHVVATGRPIDHECYIIPSKLLIAEREQSTGWLDQWATWHRTRASTPVQGRPLDQTWIALTADKHSAWALGDPDAPRAIVEPQWVSPRAAGDGKPAHWIALYASRGSRAISRAKYARLARPQLTSGLPQHPTAACARQAVMQAFRASPVKPKLPKPVKLALRAPCSMGPKLPVYRLIIGTAEGPEIEDYASEAEAQEAAVTEPRTQSASRSHGWAHDHRRADRAVA